MMKMRKDSVSGKVNTDGKISIYRVESVYLFIQNDDVIVVYRSRRKQSTGKWGLCEW